jgi:hypothetical protein
LENVNTHRLYWLSSHTGKRYHAGVAAYDEERGDYRLKIDLFCGSMHLFAKPVSVTEGLITYRIEALVKDENGALHRADVGEGHASSLECYPIFIDLGPFERTLLLEAA